MLSLFYILGLSLIFLVLLFLAGVYAFYQYQFKYWEKRGIPHTKPSFPKGDLKGLRTNKSFTQIYKDLYDRTKHEKICGIWLFFSPAIIVNEPDILKDVFIREFQTFSNRGIYVNVEEDPLAGTLFSLDGVAWRNLRVKLTPTFTSGKMKMMFPTMVETGLELVKHVQPQAETNSEIEIKNLMTLYTTDIIASVAFGIKAGAMKNPEAEFRKMGKRSLEFTFLESLKMFITMFTPSLAEMLKFKITPQVVEDFFLKAIKETMDYRRANNIQRQDFMQLLIELMDKGYIDDADYKKGEKEINDTQKFTFNEAAAQAFVFFMGGFETSSTTIAFALYELAKHPDMQMRLQKEIDKILQKHDGNFTYQAIMEMEYLDRVVAETLRMYPLVPFLVRFTTKEYQVPDTDYVIEKNMPVHINVIGIHQDERYYPNPTKFDPDRFTAEEKEKRPSYLYLPFGDGPRNCIGNRFGLLQTKVGLALLLKHYQFDVTKKTSIPIKLSTNNLVTQAEGGVYLRISKRK